MDNAEANRGNRFIVLPNAIYGDWETALVNYDRSLATDEKLKRLRALLQGYR